MRLLTGWLPFCQLLTNFGCELTFSFVEIYISEQKKLVWESPFQIYCIFITLSRLCDAKASDEAPMSDKHDLRLTSHLSHALNSFLGTLSLSISVIPFIIHFWPIQRPSLYLAYRSACSINSSPRAPAAFPPTITKCCITFTLAIIGASASPWPSTLPLASKPRLFFSSSFLWQQTGMIDWLLYWLHITFCHHWPMFLK
jgi:hypothetical protein